MDDGSKSKKVSTVTTSVAIETIDLNRVGGNFQFFINSCLWSKNISETINLFFFNEEIIS